MNTLYPLKFKPLFREKIWGGQKMKSALGIDFTPHPGIGEAWMLSGVPGSQTKVRNGFLKGNELNELLEIYMDELVGEKNFTRHKDEFPILIKFIDAHDWLSVQVHPDDTLAAKRKLGGGKTEMWYVLDAEPGARLISGFNRKIGRDFYVKTVNDKTLSNILNFEPVKKGDVFYMPAGRVHALGPGILLAEIQQTSDTTYRIYDWDRVDDQGNAREMHTGLALDAIDFSVPPSYRTEYAQEKNKTVNLVQCTYFITNLLDFNLAIAKDYSEIDSYVILICLEGDAEIAYTSGKESISKGEVLLLPAILDKIVLIPGPSCRLMEVYTI
ncbi:MAG: mannose-6-phosphate isomerase [Bacteroidetes bacterium]|nr:mannose-6-phosphate isomerase [Bacteroidota bacterium]